MPGEIESRHQWPDPNSLLPRRPSMTRRKHVRPQPAEDSVVVLKTELHRITLKRKALQTLIIFCRRNPGVFLRVGLFINSSCLTLALSSSCNILRPKAYASIWKVPVWETPHSKRSPHWWSLFGIWKQMLRIEVCQAEPHLKPTDQRGL